MVAKDSLVLAVIDTGNSDGTISPENWRLVQTAMRSVYKDIISANPGPSPSCRDAGWYQGHVKLIACADQRSADLYKQAIDRLGEIWSGAKLSAVPKDQIPNRPRSFARIPAEPSTPDEILELIKLSNQELPTADWKVAKVSEPKGHFRDALIVINDESLALLNANKGEINYGFESISLKVYKGDNPGKRSKSPMGPLVADVPAEPPEPIRMAPASTCGSEGSDDTGSAISLSGFAGDFFEQMKLGPENVAESEESLLSIDSDSNATLTANN